MTDLISSMKAYPIQSSPVSSASEGTKKKEPAKENTGMSTTVKVLTGASALAAMAIGGIILRNGVMAKKAAKFSKEIEALSDDIKRLFIDAKKKDIDYKNIFDPEKTAKYLEEAMKLPEKEKLARLKEINTFISDDRGLVMGLNRGAIKTSDLPKPIQEAIASKDHVLSAKLFREYCDTLVHKSKTAGATIQESVENVFGKNTFVKPHTYDISKEADDIVLMAHDSGSGFHTVVVNSKNEIYDNLNRTKPLNYTDYRSNDRIQVGNCILGEGLKDGKKFVTVQYPSYIKDTDGRAVPQSITLLSPNGKLTAAQKDLLSINFTASDADMLADLTVPGKDLNTNFDAILSFIQSAANRA